MGDRVETVDSYRTAEAAYNSFLDKLEVQKLTIDQARLESVVAESTELAKLINKVLQAGINSLNDSEPYQDFTQNIIDSSLSELQLHQSKVKDQVLSLTQLNQSLASIEDDKAQDIKNQETLIRALELKVSSANQGVVSAENQVSEARLELSNAQLKYENLILRTPINGTVGPIQFRVGEYVGIDKDTPVLSIIGAEGSSIEAYVEEVDVAKVQVGQTALISFDAFDSVALEGVVTFISKTPLIDANGIVTYRMVISTETADERVRDGMTTYIDVITSGVRDVLVVPVAAVRPYNGMPSVQRQSGEWVPVTTGFTDGSKVEVISGIKNGDSIIYGE
jgi:macrolide-specific efflux system membrane fusion protein